LLVRKCGNPSRIRKVARPKERWKYQERGKCNEPENGAKLIARCADDDDNSYFIVNTLRLSHFY